MSLRSWVMIGALFIGACAAESPAGEPIDDTGSALIREEGGGEETCPGGVAPRCVRCTGNRECSWSCAGGYVCTFGTTDNGTEWCGYSDTCTTRAFAPGGGTVIR